MRVIGGTLSGRRYNPPISKWPTRPTTDIAKEGIFNILQHSLDFSNVSVLDLFGGSGSMTFEFVSRGVTDMTYVDRYSPCVAFVKRQLKEWDMLGKVKIVRSDVFKFLDHQSGEYDIIFCDPPYDFPKLNILPNAILESHMLAEKGLLIIEHDRRNQFDGHPCYWKHKKYGDSIFTFFST